MAFSTESLVPSYLYQYGPLSTPKSIRLLEIISHSAGSAEFEGKLHVTDLRQYDHLPYRALSYTWKLPDTAADLVERPVAPAIVFNGHRLAIGCNLFDYLEQAMALPDDPDESDSSLVWIDAVCINQQDLNERSSQVAFMTDIYELASSVVVWLGRHDNHSRRAMPLIASFAQVDEKRFMHNPEANQYQTSLLTDAEFYEQNHIKPLSLANWNDIRSFYSRSWFHRLWTTQELVVHKSVIIECGESNLARDDVENFLAIISKRGWMRMNHEKHYAETSRYGSIFGGDIMLGIGYVRREDFTSDPREDSISDLLLHLFEYRDYDSFTCAKLAWILQMARYRETTDQRDKIFGTQGLASRYRMPGDWHLMRPDYTKTVEGVFTQAARYILKKIEKPFISIMR